MAISNRPEEKYAFLFAGDTQAQYENDVKKGYETLTKYYGYPVANIRIVTGGGSFPTAVFPGSTLVSVLNLTDLITSIGDFVSAAKTVNPDRPSGTLNNAFFYFTGKGSRETVPIFGDRSMLVINAKDPSDSAAIKITGDWLKQQISPVTDFISNCQIDFLFEQSYGGGFYDDSPTALNTMASSTWSFTSSCNSGETSTGSISGSNFTLAWNKGLQMEVLKVGANSGSFADQLTVGVEETSNLMISLHKAYKYTDDIVTTTGSYYETGGSFYYLGIPALLIRDGDHPGVGLSPYASPDIFITHPAYVNAGNSELSGNLYIQDATGDFDNVINVRVLNYGTHPVRKCYVGVSRFATGGGGTHEDRVNFNDILIEDVDNPGNFYNQILCPVQMSVIDTATIPADDPFSITLPMKIFNHISQFEDIRFPETTHRCVKAVAKLSKIELTETDTIDNELEDWVWNFIENKDEAQLNTDYSGISDPSYAPPPPPPGNGNGQENNDIPENSDDTQATESMNQNIRRFKEHIYLIRNPYKYTRKFILAFPENYKELTKDLKLEWFEKTDSVENELIPLTIEEDTKPCISFVLESGESKNILLYFAVLPKANFKRVVLTFEILTEYKIRIPDRMIIRKPYIKEFRERHARWSGFDLIIQNEDTELNGIINDPAGNPLPNAMILIQTANKRQSAIIRSDKEGHYRFPNINPDVYKITAITKDRYTKPVFVTVPHKEKGIRFDFMKAEFIEGKPVKIILEKIRIVNAHRPFFLPAGKFIFSACITPDNDASKKTVIRFPEKGKLKLSDKSGKNECNPKIILFEGPVKESFELTMSSPASDKEGHKEKLKKYNISFSGDPDKWYGLKAKQEAGDWQICYRILRL
jgi:hypothetical protein